MNNSNRYSRKELRRILEPYETKNNAWALFLCFSDYAMFFAGLYAVIVLPIAAKLFASMVVFIAITRLFILGHDACHGSLTSSRQLNNRLARLMFLPSLTTFVGWTLGHNMTHHGFANLATKDTSWRPLSPSAFHKLGLFEQLRYHFFRSHWGVCFYYLYELWWKYIFFPSKKTVGEDAAKQILSDSLTVTGFLFAWLSALYIAAFMTEQSYLVLLAFGFVIPFLAWNMMMSFVIYLHHTHPAIRWYQDQTEWAASQPHITATVHIRFPKWLSVGLHYIMEHPAHHLSMAIPCYNLKKAQHKLEEALSGHMVIQDFSWQWFLNCTSICKLYDFENRQWVSFKDD